MNALIPFGKYKGQPIEQLQNDVEYTRWLLEQSWFAERYSGIQTLIVNNFKEASSSPEHNRFQARFLDRRFVFSVVSEACKLTSFDDFCTRQLNPFVEQWQNCKGGHRYRVEFEVRGWDVKVDLIYYATGSSEKGKSGCVGWGLDDPCHIELKPAMGEDFPEVLRQVKARQDMNRVVLIEQFTAKSVSFTEVKTMFQTSRVVLLSCSDVQQRDLPDWLVTA